MSFPLTCTPFPLPQEPSMAPIAFRIKILTPQTQELTQYKPSLTFFIRSLTHPVSPFLVFQPLPRFPTHKSSHMPSSPAEETACLSQTSQQQQGGACSAWDGAEGPAWCLPTWGISHARTGHAGLRPEVVPVWIRALGSPNHRDYQPCCRGGRAHDADRRSKSVGKQRP